MTRKFGCRAMSLLLAFITLLSTVSVSFADPNVTGKGDQGNSGGGTTFGTMHDYGDNFAFRIYIFDHETGEIVSNIVDFYNDKVSGQWAPALQNILAGKAVVYKTPKLADPSDDNKYKSLHTFFPQSKVQGLRSSSTQWIRPVTGPAPPFNANGVAVKKWLLNAEGAIGGYGGSGNGRYNKPGTNYVPGDSPIQKPDGTKPKQYTYADFLNQIQSWQKNPGALLADAYNSGYYTRENGVYYANNTFRWMGMTINYMDNLTPTQKNYLAGELAKASTALANESYSSKYSWPSEAQVNTFKAIMAYANNVVKTNGDYNAKVRFYQVESSVATCSPVQQTILTNKYKEIRAAYPSKSTDAGSLFDSLFNVSYAAEDTASLDSGNLFPIMNCFETGADGSISYIFYFTNGVTMEESASGKNDAITYTCYKNGYNIAVEPVFWFLPGRVNQLRDYSNSYKSNGVPCWFYGTPTNYAEWADAAAKAGVFNDGGTGGNYQNAINKVGAGSMILLDADDALSFSSGKRVDAVKAPTSPLTHAVLKDRTKGYAIHWYTFDSDYTPSVPTYDPSIGDPPHPAPDPTTPDPGDGSYNVNIVKVYDYQHEDETIEHIETTLKQNEPGTIYIQHEPTYKVVAFFTSNTLIPGVSSSTTWEEANQAPVISGDNFSWSTVKSKTAGTTETTVYLSKAAASDDRNTGATTLYVRLLRTDVSTPVDYGANVISESQLNKVIGTDKKFGGDTTQSATWGNYLFNMSLPTPDTYNLLLETDTAWY